MHKNVYEPGSQYSCIRNIKDGMRTSSQMLLDLTAKHVIIYTNPECSTLTIEDSTITDPVPPFVWP